MHQLVVLNNNIKNYIKIYIKKAPMLQLHHHQEAY
jgi:hypothetical protein